MRPRHRPGRVPGQVPVLAVGVGQDHVDLVEGAVDDDEQVVVAQRPARAQHLDHPRGRIVPRPALHGLAVGPVPGQVGDLVPVRGPAGGEGGRAHDRVLVAQAQQEARGGDEVVLPGRQVPVVPGDRGVLAVGVVVAALGAAHLVAAQQHGCAGRDQEGAQHVARTAPPQHLEGAGVDPLGDVPVGPVVPRAVVVGAVAVVLAVGQVVLVVVADQVAQCEAVVGGDEVDARQGPAPARVLPVAEHVGAAGQARGQVAHARAGPAPGHLGHVRQPEGAHRAAVAVIPVVEGDGELPGPPAARAHVPGLGDELDAREQRVGGHAHQQGVVGVELGGVAPQRDRQVEAEAVHAHVARPVAQGVQGELDGARGAEVDRVAGAGDVDVLGGAVGGVQVVLQVVQAAQGQARPAHPRLAGVVVDHVHDDLQAGLVQDRDHAADLVEDGLGPGPAGGARGVGGLRGEVGQGRVAPVVRPAPGQQEDLGEGGVDGQHLDRGHAQVLEVVHGDRVGQARVGAAQLRGHARHVEGQPLDVGLVDDGALLGHLRPGDHREGGARDHADGHVPGRVQGRGREGHVQGVVVGVDLVGEDLRTQDGGALQGAGVGVEGELAGVGQQPLGGVPLAVDAVGVALAGPHAAHVRAPGAALGPVHAHAPLGDHGAGAVGLEQAQVDGGGVRGDDDEARAVPHGGRPQARTVAGVLGAEDRGLQLERARHEGHCPGWARPVPTPTVRVRHTPPVR